MRPALVAVARDDDGHRPRLRVRQTTRDCASVEEAKAWVETEAAALRVSVIWSEPPP
jgi:hypothetical protein